MTLSRPARIGLATAIGATVLVPALYAKHAVRYQGDEVPIDSFHESANGFGYYRFNSVTTGSKIVRAHWRVDTPILEPYAAEHYDEVKLELDAAVEFNRSVYAGHSPDRAEELMVCDVNSYGYSVYPKLSQAMFRILKTKPFFKQHTHTNVARAVCEPAIFSADSWVWTSAPNPNSLWYYIKD